MNAVYLKWPGFNKQDSVIINLPPESFHLDKDTINLLGETFIPKEELHVTLIGSGLGRSLLDKINNNLISNTHLAPAFEAIDWSFTQTDTIHILSRPNKESASIIEKSIIQLLNMRGVTEFYQQLKAYGMIDNKTPVPPPHVTLYTHNCPRGIGISSNEILNTLTEKTLSVNALPKYGIDFKPAGNHCGTTAH